jgi:diaminopimelate decarboxylase
MEYEMALRNGVPPERIIVNGPYKAPKHVERCLRNGSILNLDAATEVDALERFAMRESDRHFSVGVRCNFPLHASHRSRFGIDASDRDRLVRVASRIRKTGNVDLAGLHCHFPDRDLESFDVRAREMVSLAKLLFVGPPRYLDIGGGFFGTVPPSLASQFSARVPDFQGYAEAIGRPLLDAYGDEKSPPTLILEPGTALVADVMTLVVRVMDVREIRGRWVATTSGSRFNIGLMGSQLNLPAAVVPRPDTSRADSEAREFDIVGYTCIEGDVLHRGLRADIEVGDYLIFSNVGSYSVVFKPPFIEPDIPIIEWDGVEGGFRLVKRAQTLDDILAPYC